MVFLFVGNAKAQHNINLKLDTISNSLVVKQQFIVKNESLKPLKTIYLHAWANAYKAKTTALAKHFEENYSRSFHLAKPKDRGAVSIDTLFIKAKNTVLNWQFLKDSIDILKLNLAKPLLAGDTVSIEANYTVKLPNAKFTRYGFDKAKNYYLRYFYLIPAMQTDTGFYVMNNKNLDDLWMQQTDYTISLEIPTNYKVITDLKLISNASYSGKNRSDLRLEFLKKSNYKTFVFEDLTIATDLKSRKHKRKEIIPFAVRLERIKSFLEEKLGKYPFDKVVLSHNEYMQNPVYGVSQLPSFANPYPSDFEEDLKLLKTYLQQYMNTLQVNKRTEYQFLKGIQGYLMYEFVKSYYPDTKMLGKLAKIWGIRSFEIAKLNYNDKYSLYYQYIARKALNQSLNTPLDSLSNYNRTVANPYKAALGLRYLAAYTSDSILDSGIKKYWKDYHLKNSTVQDFQNTLKDVSNKDISWFFNNYAKQNLPIDYKIKKVLQQEDSLAVIIKNKQQIAVPITLLGIKKDSIIFNKWLKPIQNIDTIRLKNADFNRLVLNYNNVYPEINRRDNWKAVNSHSLFRKPLKIGFLEDVENPYYNQLFITPLSDYNYYDGVQLGLKFNNQTFLAKDFYLDLKPFYGLKSKSITGSGNIFYRKRFWQGKLSSYRLGLGFSYYHFADGLIYRKYTPYLQLTFRDNNYRLSKKRILTLNQFRLHKDDYPLNTYGSDAIDYNIFNFSYLYKKPGEIKQFIALSNFQSSSKFTKASFDIRYKKLTLKNRQWDLRAYFGAFLSNKSTSSYYDFNLDKPTDYLFQYGYFGRSETSGILSQQYFIAEGGFKSQFANSSANQWLFTTNISTSIWKWIEIYGDAGWLKNKGYKPQFYYDSGIRFNLVPNHFEVYFPVYSTKGLELTQAHYSSKIRLVYTTDLGRLLNFYKRSWH